MVAKGGAKLIDQEATQLLKSKLIKKVTLITPNIPEAEILTGIKIKTKEDMIFAASLLIRFGANNVFIKGGHLHSKMVHDIFVNKKEINIIENRRISTSNTHGTGCTLSSAISTFFACGKTLKKSCELATKYVNNSIRSNLNYGKGHGPINHLSSIIVDKKFR
jgi:hydroxymethylpyrimidine/phosphomethylpyrimidine kinase